MNTDSTNSAAPAESPRTGIPLPDNDRGLLHVLANDGLVKPVGPHTASGAAEHLLDERGELKVNTQGELKREDRELKGEDGEHSRQRVLAVKLDLHGEAVTYQLLRDLSWQAARYRNLFLRALWAEAKSLCVDPTKNIPHDVTKWIRADEKMDLSGAAYSAAEREVAAVWKRHSKRILAGAPLPEWKPTAALSIRGHKNQAESGVRLSVADDGKFVAHLQVRSGKSEGGSWFVVSVASGTVKDYQAEMLRKMATNDVPIAKATVIMKPGKHEVILRLCYALTIPLPRFGNRVATLGPVDRGRLFLRTECDTRDYSGRLHTVLARKEDWDLIRRRAMVQIGRHKGAARTKRRVLAGLSWEDWLSTFLHQWSREITDWLAGQGVAKLTVVGLENADWPIFKFVSMLTYKGEAAGITVLREADLADASTERAVKGEIRKQRRKATKAGKAIRELVHQTAGN